MIELKADSFTHLTNILNDIPFNTWFARSVLKGHVEGWVFVDSETNPTTMYVGHKYGMSLLWGDSENVKFNKELAEFFQRIDNDIFIQSYPSNWDSFLQSVAAKTLTRLNFRFDEKIFKKNNAGINLTKYAIKKATVGEMTNFAGRVVPSNFWKESRIKSCTAYVTKVNDEPASIAYTSYRHEDILELGIETAEAHRGKGLARAVCIQLINYCLREKLTPMWSCRMDNEGSVKLAKKLGFVETMQIPYYHIARDGK